MLTVEFNTCLTTLVLDDNELNDGTVRGLCKAMKEHPSLAFLSVERCNLGDKTVSGISALLTSNECLTDIAFDGNLVTGEGVESLTGAVLSRATMEPFIISFTDNPCGKTATGGSGACYGAARHARNKMLEGSTCVIALTVEEATTARDRE